jgi:cyanophycin synthetase
MRIVSTDIYSGPNRFALFPCILHVVDLAELEQLPTDKLGNNFIDGLLQALPSLQEHGCSYGEEGGFIKRMREGTWMGHVFEHVVIEIQNLAGHNVSFDTTWCSKFKMKTLVWKLAN